MPSDPSSNDPRTGPLTEEQRHEWEQPGVFDAAPGVHRIPLPLPNDGLKAVNVYAITGDAAGKLVLIDAGWALAESEDLLESGLHSIGRELGDVAEFLVTHLHRDHYTQAITLRRRFGGRVSIGAGEETCLRMIQSMQRNPDADRMRAAGASELGAKIDAWGLGGDDGAAWREQWEDPDRWLPNGVDLPLAARTLRAIETPGHTRGHVVYHDAEHHVLFAGDHVLPHITPSIGVEFARPPSPLRDYLASLELVRAMPDARLLPAHGPVTGSVHERVDELLAHHESRLAEIAAAVDNGADIGVEVARAIPWTRRKRRFDDMDTWNQILAVNETVAHLRVLVERSWLTESTLDGVEHFARP